MYKNLVLPGGGVIGFAYIGLFRALEDNNILRHVEAISGSSVGSLVSLLWALGFSSDDMESFAEELDIPGLARNRFGFLQGLYNLTTKHGWYSTAVLRERVSKAVSSRASADATFEDLDPKRRLMVTVTDLDLSARVVYSKETTPSKSLVDAVVESMSIPLLFTPSISENGHVMVDGLVTENTPITPFLECCNFIPKDTICVGFVGDSEPIPVRDSSLFGYARKIFLAAIAGQKNVKDPFEGIVLLEAGRVSSTDFNISKEVLRNIAKEAEASTWRHFSVKGPLKEAYEACCLVDPTYTRASL